MKQLILGLVAVIAFAGVGCTKKEEKTKVWIYTSLYKDTIADIQPKIANEFPNVDVQFYQAGSEEVAAKVQAEALAGKIQADILISSDRFWYEDLATKGNLVSYQPSQTEKVDTFYKHPNGFYNTLSFPVMVIAYNSEVVKDSDAPKSFKELADPKWKDKVSAGSPLASGTNFTTVAFLVKKYGWEYFTSLRKNNLIAEGGNSGVVRRLQSKERPVGIVLLENILRLTKTDPRIKFLIPSDGAVIQSNVLALVKKESSGEATKRIADWMFSSEGQKAMARSYMYPSVSGELAPEGAPEFSKLQATAQPWTRDFIGETLKSREDIKNQFSKIIF
jgi:iron(III) transport system substrate-binding protein